MRTVQLLGAEGSGDAEDTEGLARQHAGGTLRSGTGRACRGCSFVKKRDVGFSAGDSEHREPLLGSLVPATFYFPFKGKGKDCSFRSTSCSWKKIKKIISIQMCFSFEKGLKPLTFSLSKKKGKRTQCIVYKAYEADIL